MNRMLQAAGVVVAMVTLLGTSIVDPPRASAATPSPTDPMRIQFVAGRHTGYRYDASWTVVATKTAILTRPSSATATSRRSIGGRIQLRVSTGLWAGYWVPESTLAYIRGITGEARYSPAAGVTFAAGTYLSYRFDLAWAMTGTKKLVLTRASSAHADMRAVINGRAYVRMADGFFAGTWIPGSTAAPTAVSCQVVTRPLPGTSQQARSVTGAGPEVALTFDLGGRTVPAKAILNQLVLDRVCATIFPTGATAATTAGAAVLAIVRAHPELFEVGNHTMHHCNLRDGGGGAACPSSPPSAAFIAGELTTAGSTIAAKTGMSPIPYWRPPYGAVDTRVRGAAAAVGYTKTFLWSIDTIDWRPVNNDPPGPTAYDIAVKVRTNATSGSIVLMHLGGYNTFDALPYTLAGLRSMRLQPTTLSDLLDPAH